jgi:two-component system, LuxR family, sensor kinase FixL
MTIDVGPLVKEVIALVANEAAFRGITLRFDDPPHMSRVLADRIQIQQCLLNLLMNGFDAIAQIKSGAREVTISTTPEQNGWIKLGVCDNGPGVDPTVANRLFEPFVTTKTRGMGLGLLVTRSIIEAHGGKLWFTPNPDGGTTFSFTLPAAREKRTPTSRHEQ